MSEKDEIDRLSGLLKEAMIALEPFAATAILLSGLSPGNTPIVELSWSSLVMDDDDRCASVDDLKNAHTILTKLKLNSRDVRIAELEALLGEADKALERAKVDYPEVISYVRLREGTPYVLLQSQQIIEATLTKLKATREEKE